MERPLTAPACTLPFPRAQVIQKKVHSSTTRAILGSLIRLAQVITFVFHHSAFHYWRPATYNGVRTAVGIPTVTFWYSSMNTTVFLTLFYASLVWVTVFLGLTVWCTICFVNNSFPVMWPFKMLRAIGTLSGTVLFIPLFTLLLSTWQCELYKDNVFWKQADYVCFQGGHLAQSILSGALAVAFVALCAVFALVFYDSAPLSSNIVAKAHGRVDFIFLILKIVLVVCVETFPTVLPLWLLIGLLILCALVWTASSLYFLPFYDARWNAWTTAQACIFTYATICLAISESYHETDAAVMLYLGVGLAGAAGAHMSNARVNYIARTPATRLTSPYEIEIKARLMLHTALWGHPTDKLIVPGSLRSDGSSSGSLSHPEEPESSALDEENDDVAQRMATFRKLIAPSVLAEVQAMYRSAASRFRSSAILHVFFSRFYFLTGNKHMQMSHLLQAERRHPPLDIAFVVFQNRKAAEESMASGGSSMQLSAIARVEFEKHSVDARKLVQRAAMRQLAFWTELVEALPDLSRLHMLSTEMGTAIEQAEASFEALFHINPQSISTIRLYASFNEYNRANVDKANVLIQEAERYEDQKARDHRVEGGTVGGALVIMSESTLDVNSDNSAMLTMRGTSRNIGQIQYCNAAAWKLFGYSRLQMERRYFFSLLPEPLASLWESMVRNYMATGEGKIASTHVVFGLTRTSTIVPLLMCMRETPADKGPPGFIIQMRELTRPNESYIIMSSDNYVLAASAAALQHLALDAAALSSKEVSIGDFVAEWAVPHVQAELRSPAGCTLCIDSQAARRMFGSKLEDPMEPDGEFGEGEKTAPGQLFVRATLQAISLSPPSEDQKAEAAAAPGSSFASPGGASRSGLAARGVTRVHDEPDDTSERSQESGNHFYVLTYKPVSSTDTYGLAKAVKKRRDSLMALSGVGSPQVLTVTVPSSGASSARVGNLPNLVPGDSSDGSESDGSSDSVAQRLLGLQTPQDGRRDTRASSPSSVAGARSDRSEVKPAGAPGRVSSQDVVGVRDASPRVPPSAIRTQRSAIKAKATRIKSPRAEELEAGRLEAMERAAVFAVTERAVTERVPTNPDARTAHDTSSQMSSGSSGRRILTRLRRVLDSKSRMSIGLLALRGAGAFVAALSVALAIVAAVVLDRQFAAYDSNLTYTHMGGARVHNFFSSVVHVQNLVLLSRGWIANDAASVEAEREALRFSASAFTDAHRKMYAMLLPTSFAPVYTNVVAYPVTITVYDTPAAQGTNYGDFATYNLAEAGMLLGNLFTELADLPLANFSDDKYGKLEQVFVNCLPGGIAHETIHATSLETGYDMSVAAKEESVKTALYVYVSIAGVLGLVGFTVFAPILMMIEASKDSIVKSFVFLPTLVKKTLQDQSEKRAQALRRNFSDDEDDDDDDDDPDAPEEPGGELGAAPMSDVEAYDEVDWDSIMTRVRVGEKAKQQTGARSLLTTGSGWKGVPASRDGAFKKSYHSIVLLFVKFLGPLLALFFFFTAIYIVSVTALQDTLSLASAQVSASYRAACSKESLMDLTRAVLLRADRQFFLVELAATADTIDCIGYHQELLLYGTPVGEVRGDYVSTTPASETGNFGLLSGDMNQQIWDMQFSSACPFRVAWVPEPSLEPNKPVTLAECIAWEGGIMTHGTSAVIAAYSQRGKLVLDRRTRARVVDNTLGGYIIPVPFYPYANDTCGAPGTPPGTDCWSYPAGAGLLETSPGPKTDVHGDIDANWDPTPWSAVPWTIESEIESPDMAWMRTADKKFLTPVLLALEEMYNDAAVATIVGYRNFLRVSVAVFVVLFILFMGAVYLPQVHALHSELQKKRAMLLFLPPQVIRSFPSIRALVDQILAADTSGLGRGVSSASASRSGNSSGAKVQDSTVVVVTKPSDVHAPASAPSTEA